MPHPTTPAIVGRERELATLRAALDAALSGHGSLVLIGGEAGLGKTTLAEALLAEASARGALVLVGRCYDLAETPPYGPWAEALANAPTDAALPALPSAVLPAGQTGEALSGQEAIIHRVRAYLGALAAHRPLTVLLDDLHWADPASLEMLRVIARGLAATPLLLLGTYRDDELVPGQPLASLLAALVREARATRLDLRPIDTAALGSLVATRYTLDDADADRLVRYLATRAEGNPFFAGELLRTLEGEDILRPEPGPRDSERWILGNLAQVPVPTLLRQVIAGRAARLDPETQRLLAVAAVIGQVVPLAVWAAVAVTDEDGLLDAIERAFAIHLLEATPDGLAVRFAHALVRETLYEETLPIRRRRLHQLAGAALAAMSNSDPDAVAYHFQRSGDLQAAAWLVRAGERAQRAFAWLTAAERYEAALAVMDAGADARERARLLNTLALLRRYTDPEGGIALADQAAQLAQEAGAEALAAAARFDAGQLRTITADPGRGLRQMRAALPILEALPEQEYRQLPALIVQGAAGAGRYHRDMLMLQLANTGFLDEAWELGGEVRARDPGTTPRGLLALGTIHALRGEIDAARRALHEAQARYREAGHLAEVGVSLEFQLICVALPFHLDRPEEWRRLDDERAAAFALARGMEDRGDRAERRFHPRLLWLTGRWAALGALDAFTGNNRGGAAELRAMLARAQGDPASAWATIDWLFPAGAATEPGERSFHLRSQIAQRLAADLALDAGDLPTARAWLECHDRLLAWSGALLGRAEGHLGWAAYHRAAGDLGEARRRADAALAAAAEPRQPLALLVAHRALGELDTAENRHTAAQEHLDDALALAEACEVPYERALTLLALAELHLARGDRDGATRAAADARAILEPLEARLALDRAEALVARLDPPTPTPHASLPFGLTAREAEVLALLAAGLTDGQIAARLFVSRHTVNAHTKAIYGKLGVGTRAAATRLALEHRLA